MSILQLKDRVVTLEKLLLKCGPKDDDIKRYYAQQLVDVRKQIENMKKNFK